MRFKILTIAIIIMAALNNTPAKAKDQSYEVKLDYSFKSMKKALKHAAKEIRKAKEAEKKLRVTNGRAR